MGTHQFGAVLAVLHLFLAQDSGYASHVESPQGQLRAGLAYGLRRDDPY